jgi:hypothetical protein
MPPKIKVSPKPRPKPKPKLKKKKKRKGTGVTKQEKAAATRAGFKSVAEYRKSKKMSPGAMGGRTVSKRTDAEIAKNLGITVAELNKKRKVAKQKSLQQEATTQKKPVSQVKKDREVRKIKREKTTKKKQYTANKEKIKKLTDAGVDEKLAKYSVSQEFENLSVAEKQEVREQIRKQRREASDKPVFRDTLVKLKKDDKPDIYSGPNIKGEVTRQSVGQKPTDTSQRLSNLDPLLKKKLKKQKQQTKLQQDIITDLTKKGISKTLATKVALAKKLTQQDRDKLKKVGVKYTYAKEGSARAPTPLKKQTKVQKEARKVTNEPIPEKWSSFQGLQNLLSTEAGGVKRGTGKVGQGRGKLLPGNVTPDQIQDVLRGGSLSKEQTSEIEGLLKNPDSPINVKNRKKGGTVYRRGGGKALKGFGKATYSNKLY